MDDFSQLLFKKFLRNFCHTLEAEKKETFKPVSIQSVESVNYLVKSDPDDHTKKDYVFMGYGTVAIYKDGSRKLVDEWKDDDYDDCQIYKSDPKKYLWFFYQIDGQKTWLNVFDENTWE